jgi:hypothetical protein
LQALVFKDEGFYRYIDGGSHQTSNFSATNIDGKDLDNVKIISHSSENGNIEEVEVDVDVDISSDSSRGDLIDDSSTHSTSITLESNIEDFIKHQLPSSKDKGQYYCRICFRRFTQQVNLATHERIHTAFREEPY